MEGKGCEAKKGTNIVHSQSHMPGYDPNRIPASVFASKPTIGWSVASSETFYSFQNDSFSEPSSEPAISRSLPVVVEESRESPMSARATNEAVVGTVKDRAEQQHSSAKTPPSINGQRSSRISISSNDSHISINSFVFPILAGAEQRVHSATFEVVVKRETQSKPEAPQSMTKEEPSQKESEDKEPVTSAQNLKGGWCCCWLKCFSCCRLC